MYSRWSKQKLVILITNELLYTATASLHMSARLPDTLQPQAADRCKSERQSTTQISILCRLITSAAQAASTSMGIVLHSQDVPLLASKGTAPRHCKAQCAHCFSQGPSKALNPHRWKPDQRGGDCRHQALE
mmetsp:Transcript_16369/g.46717  ORF Transcript_16369/g.46717 Transcript_16369/m.46717 type:complete len:131 (+) Transcript_16369:114-506(+)